MEEKVAALKAAFQRELKTARASQDIDELKVRYLGKKSLLTELMLSLRDLPPTERPFAGKVINELKLEITQLLEQAAEGFSLVEQARSFEQEKIDVTLPGRRGWIGRSHPVQKILREVIDHLSEMGFSVQYGPEIDSDYYVFEGLNYAKDHPARDMQDTFYITQDLVLRSHTSNVQLHVMEQCNPPIRIIAPGTVYRNEDIGPRSHVFFHQVEGLYIDRHVCFADLLATMAEFWKKLFYQNVKTRFRPSYFPFVEPGLEVDLECVNCHGVGCRLCKQTGWLEVAGAGMVHPEVLKNGGINPEEYSGYAWGMGMERLAMLRYGIQDIRLFTENDMRFLEQF